MNNINMAAMTAMGGPVGGGMPMMNNGIPGNTRPMPVNDNQQRSQLNTYIYEYFLRNEMWECARAIIQSDQPINVLKNSPGRRRDVNGNIVDNGVSPEGTDGDSKDDLDSKRPDDLPAPNLPKDSPESCFLYEWWCLFWDMFNAQRGKSDSRSVIQYVTHTQQNSRSRQEQQQQMLRQIHRPDMGQFQMLRNQPNGMNMGSNDIARKAMHNNGRNVTPQQMQMLQQQQQAQAQQQHQKQQQMQRDGSDLDGTRRPQSPSSAENAPSPSKRPRIEGAPFNPQQGMMPNGRGQPQGIQGQQGNNPNQATQMLLNSGINPSSLTPQQFEQFQTQNPAGQTRALQNYTNSLVSQQQKQMPNKGMPNQGGPQSQGSPMMAPGQDGGAIAGYYNTGDMGANGMRPGTGVQPGSGGNHALQDYQMQLMLLEQQNKKRLMMARQEQDNMGGMPRDGPGGPGGAGPNGQPFQGTSPQGGRTGTSPNLNDPMKRGTPQLNAAGIPSPIPEGQSRGSPGAMNFMPSNMDPNMAPHFYKPQINGMDGNMVGVMSNGMRPPSSHPPGFNPMSQQQMMNMARVQQQGGGVGPVPGWQAGPNGAPMIQQTSQGPVPQQMGTPQQRAMLPPSAPATGTATNGRTQPSSPQQNAAPPTPSQANKAAPKGKKDAKPKQNRKKAATTTSATPAAATADEPATPTPATPVTPRNAQSFNNNNQNGNGQNTTNGQASTAPLVTAPPIAPPQPDPTQNAFGLDDSNMFNMSMDFANQPLSTTDVLQDFDFDSFLHQDGGDNDSFAFDAAAFMEGGEVGAE